MNIRQHLEEAQSLLQDCISDDQFITAITQSASLMANCINHGGKILVVEMEALCVMLCILQKK